MPPTYTLIRTAKWLGVAPWELARQPTYWQHWTLLAIEAENLMSDMKPGRS